MTRTAGAAAERSAQLIAAVRKLDTAELHAPSALPGWSRLTVVCHLRYNAEALLRMTRDALDGRATAYYPRGRAAQRPSTLEPRPGEHPRDVLDEWEDVGGRLDDLWDSLVDDDWTLDVTEPADNPDLGTIPLSRLALARLTEVDVHGTDLGIGFSDWSDTLVELGLPIRLEWLATRRTNHRDFDRSLNGTWLLASHDGFRWEVTVDGTTVESRPADNSTSPRATITASRRDLLALLLGRPPRVPPNVSGDADFAEAFSRAFPGP